MANKTPAKLGGRTFLQVAKAKAQGSFGASLSRLKPSAHLDIRVIHCGGNLEQLQKLPDACVDLIYIDPPFNSNRNYEVF